ncbi:MAG: sigma-54-dependent Fis family transcriptional regulator [Gemmatimonadetes bacterium]|nr:sigma-54-dependent Fis family transcriptional regulator [Gemmatimonadota bacterium]
MASILCVDDEPAALLVLRDTLERAGHHVVGVHNGPAALNVLARGGIDLIISDYRMPGMTGLEFLNRLSHEEYDVPVIMATAYASIEHAVASIKAGAIDYITKPVRPQPLKLAVEQALEFARLRRENAVLRAEVIQLRSDRELVGDSEALRHILETVSAVAPTRATVLLQGESGTGKELLARLLHELSDRRDGPFITVNCAALPESLVESTLFGHEKGAFTGAIRQVKGAFERAHRGTLLLDEVSEMRADLQAKLLRVLQEQEFERVGGTTLIRVDVRIIATTNHNLAAEAEKGAFRKDLYYRLSVVPIRVPPLHERQEDIPILAQRFAARAARELGRKISGLAPETVELLLSYHWPGNVRELLHAVERAVILSRGEILEPQAFEQLDLGPGSPHELPQAGGNAGEHAAPGTTPAATLHTYNLAEAERILIDRALRATNQNRTRAAGLLGISDRTLRNKLNKKE